MVKSGYRNPRDVDLLLSFKKRNMEEQARKYFNKDIKISKANVLRLHLTRPVFIQDKELIKLAKKKNTKGFYT